MQRQRFTEISYSYEIDFYLDKNNMPNQKLVEETIIWFESGPGKRAFTSLELLNLLYKQFNFVRQNIDDTNQLINHFQNLPLSDLEKHILFGMIIKWFGGYPLEAPMGIDKSQLYYDFRKRLLELFLNYPEETPEKEFCKIDFTLRKKLTGLSIALTDSVNGNIPVEELWEIINSDKTPKSQYSTFADLFAAAYNSGLLVKSKGDASFLKMQSLYNFKFNVWLQEYKMWEYGNHEQYQQLLNIENFKEFMQADIERQNCSRFLNGLSDVQAFEKFIEQHNRLRETFRIKRKATKEDCQQIPRLKEGDIISYDPDFKTPIEGFILLTEYYAKAYLELEKYNFLSTYKIINEETVKAEIKELEKFIASAKQFSLSEACMAYGKFGEDTREFVYRRLESGYYENLEVEKYPFISSIGNPEASMYGKYFLFYNYLKDTLDELSDEEVNVFAFLQSQIEVSEKAVAKGFYGLEKYINKNVYEDTQANLSRLKQLKRNLPPWKEQLQNCFIDPEDQNVRNSIHFDQWKKNAERMQKKIVAALDVIEVKISGREDVNSFQNADETLIMTGSMLEQKILRKGRKD